MSVLTVLKKIIHSVGYLFTNDHIDRALKIAEAIQPLIEAALPYSQMLAAVTPNKVDDALVEIANKMGRTLREILEEPDPDVRRGLLQGIVRRGIVEELRKQILINGEVKIGGIKLKTVTDIFDLLPGHFLDQAVQAAFTFFVKK